MANDLGKFFIFNHFLFFMRLNPLVSVLAAGIIFGFSGYFVKILQLNVFLISFYRLFIPLVIILIWFFIRKYPLMKVFKPGYKMMLVASLLNAIRQFLYFFGFLSTSIGNAVIIHYTWPLFTGLFSWIFLKEKISARNRGLILTAFAGIIVVYSNQEFSFSNKDFVGMSAMLLSALIYASSVIIYKKLNNVFSKTETLFYQNFLGVFIFLPFVFISPTPEIWQFSVLLAYVLMIGVIAYLLFFYSLKTMPASRATHYLYVEVIVAVMTGVFFFGESLELNTIVGGILILLSMFFIRR